MIYINVIKIIQNVFGVDAEAGFYFKSIYFILMNQTPNLTFHISFRLHCMFFCNINSKQLLFHSWNIYTPRLCSSNTLYINLLKPTGYVMHQQILHFNNCTLCPHCIYVFCIYLGRNSDLCHLHHKLIGFYNRDEKCLLRGINGGFE